MLRKYINVLKLARKPDKKEYWQYTKLIFLGILILGSISYVIGVIFGLFITI